MEKKILITGRGIETADLHDKRKNIPDDLKHLQRAAQPQTVKDSYRKWRTERIEHLKLTAQWGNELAELMREQANEKG
ncbi:MAG: hypothetical protein IT261_14600 [Saprospiraceae bacterium]|nr:hypothetical protein [Saprospiraceae bacterium]